MIKQPSGLFERGSQAELAFEFLASEIVDCFRRGRRTDARKRAGLWV